MAFFSFMQTYAKCPLNTGNKLVVALIISNAGFYFCNILYHFLVSKCACMHYNFQ